MSATTAAVRGRATRHGPGTVLRDLLRRRWFRWAAAGAVALFGASWALQAAGAHTEIDLTTADATETYNDAIFVQGDLDISAGTGVLSPFQTTQGGGSQDISAGYNTVDASAEFDTVTGGDRNRPLLLSGLPEVEVPGQPDKLFREFKLDINKAKGGNSYMAISELKLFLTDDPAITGYDYDEATDESTAPEFGADATKVWDLNEVDPEAVVLMDYFLESGSGASDVTVLIDSSRFDTDDDCSYGSTACTTYLVLWSEYGDYAGGEDSLYPDRTWENNDGFEEWAIVLRPVLDSEKTAAGEYERTITWDVDKVDDATYDNFIGDAANVHPYTVSVDKTVVESDPTVTGTITMFNPTGNDSPVIPVDVPVEIVSVEDVIDQGGTLTIADVTCPETFPYTLGGGETLVCTYEAITETGDPGVNTATITVQEPDQIGGETREYVATADVEFTVTTNGPESIDVTDSNGESWTASDDASWNYTRDFVCPTDTAAYEDGMYSETVENTATIDQTGQSDTATVTQNCYLWDVTKTAEGTYNDRYEWDITKTVDPESQSGFAGDTLEWEWSITWESSFVEEENHAVSGVITVVNPAPIPLTVDVADEPTGGLAASVSCNDGDGGTSLTIAADS
jgi:hypothetical protein